MIYRGDIVEKDGKIGRVETITEEWLGLELIYRLAAIAWDDGTVTDENAEDVKLVSQKA